MSSSPDLRIAWCSFDAAKYAVESWHYSGTMPRGYGRPIFLGAWEVGEFIGAIVFSRGANNNLSTPYGLTQFECAELVRVALRAHKTPVSRIVAIALRMMKVANSRVRLVVSFADPEHGHVGSIYQAGGWIYAGMTSRSDEYIVNGRRMHGRALRQTRASSPLGSVPARNVMEWAAKTRDPAIQRVQGSSKHRYLMPLDDEMRVRIASLAKSYPRASRLESEAPGGQPGDEGAAMRPTRSITGGLRNGETEETRRG